MQICLHSCCVIVLDAFFLLLLRFTSYIRHVSTVFLPYYCFYGHMISARILALVYQLYERNKLKLKLKLKPKTLKTHIYGVRRERKSMKSVDTYEIVLTDFRK